MDHMIGNTSYARAHNHIELSNLVSTLPEHVTHPDNHNKPELVNHSAENDDHADWFLCLLDINLLFFAMHHLDAGPFEVAIGNPPLHFELFSPYQNVSSIYISLLSPPPRI
ncbi:MAG TPA: hypothetical protein VLL52_00740 [Anaerolineae bacterium]|nr:hypothetical protein [Anaerolineae bacterium]